jgi:serine protease
MKKAFIALLVVALMLTPMVTSPISAFAQDFKVKSMPVVPSQAQFVPGEIIVKFTPAIPDEVIDRINQGHGSSVIYTSPFAGFKRLRIPPAKTIEEMVEIYSKNPNVEYAEPNAICYAFMVPNDPLYPYQWHLYNTTYGGIHIESAWDIQQGDPSVIIGILDTGVAYENYGRYVLAPDLAGTSFVQGYDFVNNDTHPNDDEGHGTHVTGTIAQSTNNNLGVAGIAFNCSIMPVKVLNAQGSGTTQTLADGLYFAANNGADVVNMSLGWPAGYNPGTTLENAIAYAYNAGVTLVASSGNEGVDVVSYPAAYDDYVIAVGATRYDEQIAYYSQTGSSLDLTAPGGDVTVDQNGDGYGDGVLQQTFDKRPSNFGYWFYQGTSMASPHVAGVAALVIANGVTGPDNVRNALQSTAEDHGTGGWDSEYGWGIVDAAAALEFGGTPNQPPVADAGGPYNGNEDNAIEFNGSGCYDPDGDPLTYAWDFGDGSTGEGVMPTHTYSAGGTYTVTLVVNDGKVDSEPSSTTATVEDIFNDPPVADANGPYNGAVGNPITFDGSGSYDEEGVSLSYSWDFGDTYTGTGVTPTHAYVNRGTYTVTLVVNDGNVDSEPSITTATVTDVQAMHVADIEMSTAERTAGRNVFTKAVATVTIVAADGTTPVEGATVSGHWSGLTSDTDTFVTGGDGTGSCESDEVKKASGTFTFTVDNVVLSGWTYDEGANVVTNASITVPTGNVASAPVENVLSNYPNPANPETVISYSIGQPGYVTLKVYNTLGHVVRTLVNEVNASGTYTVRWDGKNNQGIAVTSGIYFYQIRVGAHIETRKLLLAR